VKVEDGVVYVTAPREEQPPAVEGEDDRTFVMVGAGAAGNAAAETLRREGFAGRIVLVTAESVLPYDRPTLSKELMAGEAKPEWLPLHDAGFYDDRGIELMTGRRVAGIDPAERVIEFEDGDQLSFDKALLATGATPRNLDIPGADLEGYFLLRSRADAEAIDAALEGAETAVIIGASFIGMEVGWGLRQRGLDVHVVAPENVPMSRIFGEAVGKWLHEKHEEAGVQFHLGATPEEVRGNGAVEEVLLSNGQTLPADLVVAGVGVRPAVGFLEGSGLLRDGVVPVDATLQTEAEDIYAAGDIALVPSHYSGESHRIEHWTVAERQGQHAARAMLGSDELYKEIPFFWTHQADASITHIGYPGETDEVVVRGEVGDGEWLIGFYANGRLRAAACKWMDREILSLMELMKAGKEIPADVLADPSTDLVGMLETVR
jgi:NADPH-dependent 2,4-dienoyl-CoA reductase/sulfur reductase-like enzyme